MPFRHPDLPRVLSSVEAQRLGISRSAARHARAAHGWQLLARGFVLTAAGEATRDDWVLVAMESTGPHAALSGWDAVQLRGLGARMPPSPDVLVLDRGGRHRRLGRAIIRPTSRPYSAELLPSEHPTLPYIPVVEPARAVVDTALMYRTFDPVRALVTSSVQRQVCRPQDLIVEYARCPRQGSRWLRRALDDVVAGAKSIAEAEAIERLGRLRVPTFEANVPIVDRYGTLLAEADLLWRDLRVIVEIDSREFHYEAKDWEATMARHTFLTRRGFHVEHHSPSTIRADGAGWAAGVAAGLRARAVELGLPYEPGNGPLPVPPAGHRPIVLR